MNGSKDHSTFWGVTFQKQGILLPPTTNVVYWIFINSIGDETVSCIFNLPFKIFYCVGWLATFNHCELYRRGKFLKEQDWEEGRTWRPVKWGVREGGSNKLGSGTWTLKGGKVLKGNGEYFIYKNSQNLLLPWVDIKDKKYSLLIGA